MPTTVVTSSLLTQFERYLRHQRGLSENTVRAYHGDLMHLAAFVALGSEGGLASIDESLQMARLADMRSWLAAMAEDGLSRTTLARRGAACRAFYTWAADAGKGRARKAGLCHRSEPRAEVRESRHEQGIVNGRAAVGRSSHKRREVHQVAVISAHGVLRKAALMAQVPLELREQAARHNRGWHGHTLALSHLSNQYLQSHLSHD